MVPLSLIHNIHGASINWMCTYLCPQTEDDWVYFLDTALTNHSSQYTVCPWFVRVTFAISES